MVKISSGAKKSRAYGRSVYSALIYDASVAIRQKALRCGADPEGLDVAGAQQTVPSPGRHLPGDGLYHRTDPQAGSVCGKWPTALGKKNWLFIGEADAGENSSPQKWPILTRKSLAGFARKLTDVRDLVASGS